MATMIATMPSSLRAVVVGLTLKGGAVDTTQAYLAELAALAETYGLEVVGTFVQQVERPHVRTWVGTGKVGELAAYVQEQGVSYVLTDDDLTPSQLRNLTRLLKVQVWDRSLLILAIFATHARTSQAKVQVALAQQLYLLPRLTGMWTHLSRQRGGGGGGAGMQGTGEKELETDKRRARERIALLKVRLAKIERQEAVRRQRQRGQVRVALVGYTNAGKSTLMQQLTGAEVVVADRLFATLTTTVRKAVLGGHPFLLSDTVGFIRKLPHGLIESFKATLATVAEADLLLQVVDVGHAGWQEHVEVVGATLAEMGAGGVPMLLVLNKMDLLVGRAARAAVRARAEQYGVPYVMVGAADRATLVPLQKRLGAMVAGLRRG